MKLVRMLFPTAYWYWRKTGNFNAFLFWVDLCLWAVIMAGVVVGIHTL